MYNIRLAEEEDCDIVVEMGEKFYNTMEISKMIPFDKDSGLAQFFHMLDNGFVLLVERKMWDEGESASYDTVGMLGCHFYDYPYNRDYRGCMEAMYWLEPEVRGSSIASKLLQEAESIAQTEGVQYLAMIALETSPEMIDKFYKVHGFERSERTFIKGL